MEAQRLETHSAQKDELDKMADLFRVSPTVVGKRRKEVAPTVHVERGGEQRRRGKDGKTRRLPVRKAKGEPEVEPKKLETEPAPVPSGKPVTNNEPNQPSLAEWFEKYMRLVRDMESHYLSTCKFILDNFPNYSPQVRDQMVCFRDKIASEGAEVPAAE